MAKQPKHSNPQGEGRHGQAKGRHSVEYTREGWPKARPGQLSMREILNRLRREK